MTAHGMEDRLARLEARVERVDAQAAAARVVGLGELHRDVLAIRAVQAEQGLALGRLETTQAGHGQKLDRLETTQAGHGQKLDRLEAGLAEVLRELRQDRPDRTNPGT